MLSEVQKDTLSLWIDDGVIWWRVLHKDLCWWKLCLQSLSECTNSLILQASVHKQLILWVIRESLGNVLKEQTTTLNSLIQSVIWYLEKGRPNSRQNNKHHFKSLTKHKAASHPDKKWKAESIKSNPEVLWFRPQLGQDVVKELGLCPEYLA